MPLVMIPALKLFSIKFALILLKNSKDFNTLALLLILLTKPFYIKKSKEIFTAKVYNIHLIVNV